MQTEGSDIIIAGGGLNGPALALALAQGGFRVTLVDARPAPTRAAPGFDGRAYALAIASVRLLSAIGVWPRLADLAQPILQIRTGDGARGNPPFFLTFDQHEIEEGPMGQMVEDRHLYAAFLDTLTTAPGVTLLSGDSVTAQTVDPAGVTVTLASGRHLRAGLLVGCDGRGSGVAHRAGIRRVGWDYGQTALVTAIRHDHDHAGVAEQVFLASGPLAVLPLKGGHLSSIVYSEADATAAAVQALPDADYLAVLRPRLMPRLGEIGLAGTRFTYPLSLSLAERFIAPRVALVGDAAHGVHPIAGQGLNLGLRDVAALAEVLTLARRRGEDPASPTALADYQRWRRFDATALALGMDTVNRVFSTNNPLLRLGRDLGMGLVHHLPPLRRTFMREAAGLSGRLPRLLTGRAV